MDEGQRLLKQVVWLLENNRAQEVAEALAMVWSEDHWFQQFSIEDVTNQYAEAMSAAFYRQDPIFGLLAPWVR